MALLRYTGNKFSRPRIQSQKPVYVRKVHVVQQVHRRRVCQFLGAPRIPGVRDDGRVAGSFE